MAALAGKLTKKLVENLGPGRHGDGAGLVIDADLASHAPLTVIVQRPGHEGTEDRQAGGDVHADR